jgi:hypothetical protein
MSTIDPGGSYTPPPPPPPTGGYLPPQPPAGGYQPNDIATLKIFFIVSLVVNAVSTGVWLLTVFGIGAATCGVGCLLIFIPAVACLALVFDALAIQKLGLAPNPAVHSFLKTTCIIDIVSGVITVGIVPVVMGILALINLQKPELLRYFGIPVPPLAPPPPPTSF